ncbi:MAG: box helicase domain protein [Cyanobacteria bacterium RYN_339]|nr:box helicase domain protein [Cyanobacteria bacterium RYN_339]
MTTESFAEWPLRQPIRDTLAQLGFTQPTPVQTAAFPRVLAGGDLLVQSRTGTGKTMAYGLPILERMSQDGRGIEALVVVPTRELALQVGLALGRVGQGIGVEVATLYGGGSYRDQFRALERGARIVVGTPGRLVDHIEKGSLKLGNTQAVVLDEADEMLDMGFAEELDKILGALPKERQNLLFSATMPPETEALAKKTLKNPETIAISSGLTAAPEIKHVGFEIFPDHKHDALVNVLHAERPELAIVFCHTKEETERLASRLSDEGFKAAYLNGDLPQAARTQVLNAFRRRQIDLLIATDVAARGIDVKNVSHVINLGVPRDPETYVHRVGRTGRAGQSGVAVTFVPPRDAARFRRMLQTAGINLELRPLPQADEVRAALRARAHERLVARSQSAEAMPFHQLADELLAYMEPRDLVSALLSNDAVAHASLEAGLDIPVPKLKTARQERQDRPENQPRPERKPRVEGAPREEGDEAPTGKGKTGKPLRAMKDHQEQGMTRMHVNVGKSQRMAPGRLVQLVCSLGNLTGDAVGMIEIHQFFTFFDVKEEFADQVVDALTGRMFEGKKVKAVRV